MRVVRPFTLLLLCYPPIKAYIKRTGQYLCSMSWEGYEEMGRGAIFANYDDARADGKLNDVSIKR